MRELTPQERIDVVRYRIENAHKTLDEVQSHIEMGYYNTAVNRMYYACYYAVGALLVANKIVSKSHEGVKHMFGLHFVKTGKISDDLGKFYSNLFEKRTRGDYEDLFDNNLATCNDIYSKAKEFVETVEALINNNPTK